MIEHLQLGGVLTQTIETLSKGFRRRVGLAISDRYPDSMVPGGMVFLRCNADHHGVALVGGARQNASGSLNHFAFEVATLDEVFRTRAWLSKHDVPIVFEGCRRFSHEIGDITERA